MYCVVLLCVIKSIYLMFDINSYLPAREGSFSCHLNYLRIFPWRFRWNSSAGVPCENNELIPRSILQHLPLTTPIFLSVLNHTLLVQSRKNITLIHLKSTFFQISSSWPSPTIVNFSTPKNYDPLPFHRIFLTSWWR